MSVIDVGPRGGAARPRSSGEGDTMRPKTRYTSVGDAKVAYQVFGEGALDLVVMFPFGAIDIVWDSPHMRRFYERLATFSRVIIFDRRGQGSSDAAPIDALGRWEQWVDDLGAVLDAVNSERTAIFGPSVAGAWALVFAASAPDRVTALVLFNTSARPRSDESYPIGVSPDVGESIQATAVDLWGSEDLAAMVEPGACADPAEVEFLARWSRLASPPAATAEQLHYANLFDIRAALSSVTVPTLVLHNNNALLGAAHGQYLADHIPGAQFVQIPGEGIYGLYDDMDALVDHIQEFLTGIKPTRPSSRVLASVLFTDLVGSTELARQLGDRRWKDLLDTHDSAARSIIDAVGGQLIKLTGDGVVATFDGPGRAIQCAMRMRDALAALNLAIYAGVHTGEVELRGDDIGGVSVHIASRVIEHAAPGEILCSRTVKDLMLGSEISFEDRGTHSLKGVDDVWQLFAVRA
jgi:class 3 adenylate cyclase/pimeloyl-ACP methyl ester carboxylesterase